MADLLPVLGSTRSSLRPGEARIILALAALVAAALLIIGIAVHLGSVGQDRLEQRAEERAVETSLRVLRRTLAESVHDYAWWDDAMRHLVLEVDPDWADRNIGANLLQVFGYNSAFVVAGDGSTVYGQIEGDRSAAEARAVLGPGLDVLLAQARAQEGLLRQGVAAVLANGGQVLAVAASRIEHEAGSTLVVPPGPPSLLVFAKRLDRAYLDGLALDLGLHQLLFARAEDDPLGLAGIELQDADGRVVQRLVWEPQRPGRVQRDWLLPALALSLLVFAAFAVAAIRQVRQATAAIGANELLLRTVVESLPFDLWACSQDGRYLLQNSTSRRYWGDRVGLRPGPAGSPPEVAGIWVQEERRALAGETVRSEVAFTVAGERRLVERILEPIRNDGGVLGYLGVHLDLIERRQAEAALRASEERLRLAIEATSLGIWDVDPVSGERRWSDECKAILGLPPDAHPDVGLFASLIHPADREWVTERYRRAYEPGQDGRYMAEFRILRADDRAERWLLTTGRVWFDDAGLPTRAVGTLVDVTERKRAEAALRESEERYRTLVETSPDAVHVHQDGIIILANVQACTLLAAGPGGLVGREAFSIVDESSLALAKARTARLTAPGLRNDLAEFNFRRLDGTLIQVEAASACVLMDGRPAIQVAFRDITARKSGEQHQQLLLQELTHRVKNTLAVVQSIAARSLTDDKTPAEAREAFTKRLRALASAHTLLTAGQWHGASLRTLAAAELEPYGEQVSIEGADVPLGPKIALTLGLVLHELATNAAKHGALSAVAGRVRVAWTAEGGLLRLVWREQGGPPVRTPERRGFGRMLVEQIASYDLGGKAHLTFAEEGVVYELEAALASEPGFEA